MRKLGNTSFVMKMLSRTLSATISHCHSWFFFGHHVKPKIPKIIIFTTKLELKKKNYLKSQTR